MKDGMEATALSPNLGNTLYNFWGLRVSGNDGHLIITDGKGSLSLMTDKPGSILSRFADAREAATFLAGIWFGHKAEPITHDGSTAIVVVV